MLLLGTNVLGRDTDYSSFLTYYRLMLDMLNQTLPNAKDLRAVDHAGAAGGDARSPATRG